VQMEAHSLVLKRKKRDVTRMNSQMWTIKVKSMCTNQNRVIISTNWNQMVHELSHERQTFTWFAMTWTCPRNCCSFPYNIFCWWWWGLFQSGKISRTLKWEL
jgi:hypothetical protein